MLLGPLEVERRAPQRQGAFKLRIALPVLYGIDIADSVTCQKQQIHRNHINPTWLSLPQVVADPPQAFHFPSVSSAPVVPAAL